MSEDHQNKGTRKRIFREELSELQQKGYIDQNDYYKVNAAYEQYQYDLLQPALEAEKEPYIDKNIQESSEAPTYKKPKKKKAKKQKTAEQIRERNITWSLILGVILLLTGGLVVGTSTWDQMGPVLKVFTLSFISLFFYGLSWVAGRLLNIHQTAFAFLTLGSLFIPIAFLSIGYFGLFGPYLSLYGDGREWLGLLAALFALPIYLVIAQRHQSRLFTWLSFLGSTFLVGFLLAGLEVSVDVFYLGLMVYNAALLALYHFYKTNSTVQLFMKELPPFAQLNLVISTLLLLNFYESEVFYSFNLLLTATIYMSMVFVYHSKYYQFVSHALVAYGLYELIHFTPLQQVDLVLYALIGLVYLGLQYMVKHDNFMKQVFYYTSALVSLAAFMYITVQGILLRGESSSFLLLIAYLVIVFNYGYLAYQTKRSVFAYFALIFVFVSAAQGFSLIELPWLQDHFALYMFCISSLLYGWVWLYRKPTFMRTFQQSGFVMSVLVMVLFIIYATLEHPTGYDAGLLLVLFSGIAYVTWRTTFHKGWQDAALWAHPISIALGMFALHPQLSSWFPMYQDQLIVHVACTGLLLLIVQYCWKQLGVKAFENASFIIGQIVFSISLMMVVSGDYGLNVDTVLPLLLLIAIGVYTLLLYTYRYVWMWWLVSGTTLAFYGSLFNPLNIQGIAGTVTFSFVAPIVLIALAEIIGLRWRYGKQSFFWLAHIIQPFLVAGGVLLFVSTQGFSPFLYLLPLAMYLYSTVKATIPWQQYSFLYI
ncbi:hypothetical protein [Pontibacillus yanchengensis]|uniref:DUF2157 domain-containing protein n=1 Tax=Pontibacillus yanchengensis Y32 TaxID=1385514 RepID=A0A0A2T947_9BACI|nr:hypothetical protein [Pontibacillus yanchengensis]KGP70918.1 hypothetical protein N782_02825 [Pontibacillus yanchengensis Y32]